ncbi:MAG: M1 family peptidase, partial [Bacteroidota bacterium]
AYAKPATALNILRETVMGPELFDKAFKTYSERWAFKHPTPADFFRTLEDASAVDLDWFWRGWFFGTDYVDVDLANVRWFQMQTEENGLETRNIKGSDQAIDGQEDGSKDFGTGPQPFVFREWNGGFGEYRQSMDQNKIKQAAEGKNFYELTLKNQGGLVTPVLIEWTYVDGTTELQKIPAEIWKINEKEVTKVFIKEKEVAKIVVDPNKMTADAYTDNNVFPRVDENDRFEDFKEGKD